MPNVHNDKVEIFHIERDDGGAKVEAEEMPSRRVLDVSEPAKLGLPGTEKAVDGAKPFNMSVALDMPAHQIATGMSRCCFLCKHYDNAAWLEQRRHLQSTIAGQQELAEYEKNLIEENAATPETTETAMRSLGICHPLTEAMNADKSSVDVNYAITYPQGQCPSALPNDKGTKLLPWVDQFQPRSGDAEKMSTTIFDTIMRKAQGRIR